MQPKPIGCSAWVTLAMCVLCSCSAEPPPASSEGVAGSGKQKAQAVCGNGKVDPGEACEPAMLYEQGCPEPWGVCYQCRYDCQWILREARPNHFVEYAFNRGDSYAYQPTAPIRIRPKIGDGDEPWTLAFRYKYDRWGRRLEESNGTYTFISEYDEQGRASREKMLRKPGELLGTYVWEYDGRGLPVRRRFEPTSLHPGDFDCEHGLIALEHYKYDSNDQLTEVSKDCEGDGTIDEVFTPQRARNHWRDEYFPRLSEPRTNTEGLVVRQGRELSENCYWAFSSDERLLRAWCENGGRRTEEIVYEYDERLYAQWQKNAPKQRLHSSKTR